MTKAKGHNDRRAAFAAAAGRVLARRGLAALTVRNVAKEAGRSSGALVHYFPSKSELFMGALEHAQDIVQPKMNRDEASYGGLEGLRRVIYDTLPMTPRLRELWSVWLVLWDRAKIDPTIALLAEDLYSQRQHQLERIIRRAQHDGSLDASADPEMLAQLASVLIDGIAVQRLRSSARLSDKRQRELVDEWVNHLPPPARRRSKR